MAICTASLFFFSAWRWSGWRQHGSKGGGRPRLREAAPWYTSWRQRLAFTKGAPFRLAVAAAGTWVVLVACGTDPSIDRHVPEPVEVGGEGGEPPEPPPDGPDTVVDIGAGGEVGEAGQGGAGGAPDPCGDCGRGQRCEVNGRDAECIDNECDDLDCHELEECRPAPGGGHYCVSIACLGDDECPEARHCDVDRCTDDVCEADARRCEGSDVWICSANGSEEVAAFTCSGAGYFESECVESPAAGPGCTCEGDWDCPEHASCEIGTCTGTGREAECTLPTLPFETQLPERELAWGGLDRDHPEVTGSPFSWSGQVSSTPVVMNLTDDNGDGFVNELDFPEILFISNHGDNSGQEGIVRAIHGGGPDRGQDYFAICGNRHWLEGEPLIEDCDPSDSDPESRTVASARSGGVPAAGDLDGDGLPEIVVPLETGGFQLLDHEGALIFESPPDLWEKGAVWSHPAPAVANLDFSGLAEIVVGNRVVTFKIEDDQLAFDRVFVGTASTGTQDWGTVARAFGPMVCVADLTDDPGLEIVAGASAYRLPDRVDCALPANQTTDYCRGQLTLVWDARAESSGQLAQEQSNGFCAVADVLGEDQDAAPGPDNLLDQRPEVVLIAGGSLVILDGRTGELLRLQALAGGDGGGAPNIDDFDGDGFPEIATALSSFYTVIDLQDPDPSHCPLWPDILVDDDETGPPRDPGGRDANGRCSEDADCNQGAVCNPRAGRCTCLHNGWRRDTEDDSSRATSSSMFDFNGDGATEVIYHDECYFRIYDGAQGTVLLALPSLSRTLSETPVVADVDNDGNSEIIFSTNNFVEQCAGGDRSPRANTWGPEDALDSWPDGDHDVPKISLPNGIEVWGDPEDRWVPTRRVWNQASYHVTNVTEGGALPQHEPESWRSLNGRLYNSYRTQPRERNLAPDLTVTALQISSPGSRCGELSDEIEIVARVRNEGDLRIGPDVEVAFYGTWANPDLSGPLEDDQGDPLVLRLGRTLQPGASVLLSVTYRAGSNGRDDLPVEITALVDPPVGDEDGAERECDESNNARTEPVVPGEALPDLRLSIERAEGCDPPYVTAVVTNDGATPASDVLIRIYAGDPDSGAAPIGEAVIPGPIEPGASESVEIELDPINRNVTLWSIADPLGAIDECNDANNLRIGPTLTCGIVPK